MAVLPNVITKESVSQNMGICRKHWPAEAPMKKSFGKEVPVNPPSVFSQCPASFQRQTVTMKPRFIDGRKVSSTSRCILFDELETFNLHVDAIPSDLVSLYEKLTLSSAIDLHRHRAHFLRDGDKVIISFSESFRDIEYSLSINSDFSIIAFRRNAKISLIRF